MKQYIIHIYRGVEASITPVKTTVKAALKKVGYSEEDSVHLLEISSKGIPTISDFTNEELEEAQ